MSDMREADSSMSQGHELGTPDGKVRPNGLQIVLVSLWHVVCIPVYAVLAVFRPLIGVVLAGIGMLGILIALFLRFIEHLPHFSFWTVLSISVGCLVMIAVYDVMVELFRPRWYR
jgi:hypothetical protein